MKESKAAKVETENEVVKEEQEEHKGRGVNDGEDQGEKNRMENVCNGSEEG